MAPALPTCDTGALSELGPTADCQRARDHVLRFGRDAVAFQGLESACRYWFDAPAPEGTGACVAYVDTGGAWVAAGSPLAPPDERARATRRFVDAARAAGRRACLFCAERAEELDGFTALRLGEQPVFEPARWAETVAKHRRLKEQLRRARAKGVRVRRVAPAELAAGAPLRARVEAIAAAWLHGRHLEPMGFLVALEPFVFPDDHRYYVAERGDEVVAFTSLVPVPARRGWLVEDTVRIDAAPNGTTELLLDAAMRDAADAGDAVVTLGLAPLSGPVAPWLRLARFASSPLYDFRSLRAFKQRLHPAAWEPVWMVHRPRRRILALLDALRAFAGGSLVAFGVRSVVRHPSGLPWLLAVPLVPWTLVLATVLVADGGGLLGFSAPALAAWVAWDALLAGLLFRVARRPRRRRLRGLAAAAALDAALSVLHLGHVGLGAGALAPTLRLAGTIAPVLGTLALAWAAHRAPPPAPHTTSPPAPQRRRRPPA